MVERSSFSNDIKTSIEEGFYIDRYLPSHSSYLSPNRLDSITFDSAWIEHSYELKRTLSLCVCEHKIKGDSYNFCAPFTGTNPAVFDLKHLYPKSDPFYDPGSFMGGRFNFGLNAIQDTIKIELSFKQSSDSQSKPTLDTVYFIKKHLNR
jgi:hypothetical protein